MRWPRLRLLVLLTCAVTLVAGELSYRRAPSFSLPDMGFKFYDLQDYSGRVVLVVFMQTASTRCVRFSEILERIINSYGDKVAVVSIVNPPDTAVTARQYIATNNITVPILFDCGQAAASYLKATPDNPTFGVPHLFIIDGQGIIRNDYGYESATADVFEGRALARELDRILGVNRSLELEASGSGFVVSRSGHVITNYHLVKDCRVIKTLMQGEQLTVNLVGQDAVNDLAVLGLPRPTTAVARFSDNEATKLGEPVLAMGFPLRGVLASSANLTEGIVSALAGIKDDSRMLQITAAVQPGNSGGPLLDRSGNVIGVVSSKLDALRTAQLTGDIPQNVNFAIRASVVRRFLDANGVTYLTGRSTTPSQPTVVIAERAKEFTLPIECWK